MSTIDLDKKKSKSQQSGIKAAGKESRIGHKRSTALEEEVLSNDSDRDEIPANFFQLDPEPPRSNVLQARNPETSYLKKYADYPKNTQKNSTPFFLNGCGVGDGGSRRLEFQYNPLSR